MPVGNKELHHTGRIGWLRAAVLGANDGILSTSSLVLGALRANISETSLVPLINVQQGEKEKGRNEREFSWCCSFPWGFGCRGTERRLAWRAAAECSGSPSGRHAGLLVAA